MLTRMAFRWTYRETLELELFIDRGMRIIVLVSEDGLFRGYERSAATGPESSPRAMPDVESERRPVQL